MAPVTFCQSRIIFVTALLLISTIFSSAFNPVGGALISVNVEKLLTGSAVPSSTKSYLPVSWPKAVTLKVPSPFSETLTTRHVVGCKVDVSRI